MRAIAPLVAAVTLGIVRRDAYGHQVSRNEAVNHAGNAANAALSGVLGYTLGLGFVSIAIVIMAVASCGVLIGIDKGRIDHDKARGGEQDERSTLRVLFETKPLLLLAAAVFAYQTANGACCRFWRRRARPRAPIRA